MTEYDVRTFADDVEKAIKEIKGGRVEYRSDKQGNLHVPVGKVSFKADALENNLKALLKALREAKPTAVKGAFLKSMKPLPKKR